MNDDEPPCLVLDGSDANGSAIISRQPLGHPGMLLVPAIGRRVQQYYAERIRGGCCLCQGGSLWVCASAPEDGKDQPPPTHQIDGPQPSQAGLVPALRAPPSLNSLDSDTTKASVRAKASSLPSGSQRPGLAPISESKLDRRMPARTMPSSQARPPPPSSYQRQGPRKPAHSMPTKPSGI